MNISYKPTTRLWKNINEIGRLYGQLEGMQIPKSLLLNLERDNLVQSSFSSNSIEGNPLSRVEVTNLLLDDRIAANRDEKEVINYFNILKNLRSKIKEQFNVELILEVHKQLLDGVNNKIKGNVRNKKVVVGYYGKNNKVVIKHEPPSHNKNEIIKMLKELTQWVNKSEEQLILKAGLYHHQFVYIHPFEDGNGRVCRLTTALIFLKYGYLINRYFVLDDYYDLDRVQYSDKLHSADNGNTTEWLEYFTEGVKYSLQSALSKIRVGLERIQVDMRPTPKEKEVLEIVTLKREVTSNDLVKDLKVSRQQASRLLRILTEKGYLEKFGSTKNSYYKLV